MIVENLTTLKLHRMNNEQFEREKNNDRLDDSAIYFVPEEFVEDDIYKGCYYRKIGNEKEWVNPPMILGEEYRTIKKYNGKPIYTKLDNLGKGPGDGQEVGFVLHTSHSATDNYKPWRIIQNEVTLEKINEYPNFHHILLPYNDSEKIVHSYLNSTYSMALLNIVSNLGDFSEYDVYAQFWYYKQ